MIREYELNKQRLAEKKSVKIKAKPRKGNEKSMENRRSKITKVEAKRLPLPYVYLSGRGAFQQEYEARRGQLMCSICDHGNDRVYKTAFL